VVADDHVGWYGEKMRACGRRNKEKRNLPISPRRFNGKPLGEDKVQLTKRLDKLCAEIVKVM